MGVAKRCITKSFIHTGPRGPRVQRWLLARPPEWSPFSEPQRLSQWRIAACHEIGTQVRWLGCVTWPLGGARVTRDRPTCPLIPAPLQAATPTKDSSQRFYLALCGCTANFCASNTDVRILKYQVRASVCGFSPDLRLHLLPRIGAVLIHHQILVRDSHWILMSWMSDNKQEQRCSGLSKSNDAIDGKLQNMYSRSICRTTYGCNDIVNQFNMVLM